MTNNRLFPLYSRTLRPFFPCCLPASRRTNRAIRRAKGQFTALRFMRLGLQRLVSQPILQQFNLQPFRLQRLACVRSTALRKTARFCASLANLFLNNSVRSRSTCDNSICAGSQLLDSMRFGSALHWQNLFLNNSVRNRSPCDNSKSARFATAR